MQTLPFANSPLWDLEFTIHVPSQPQTMLGRFFAICGCAVWSSFDSSIWSWIKTGDLNTTLGAIRWELGEATASAALEKLWGDRELPDHLVGMGIDVLAQALVGVRIADCSDV